MRYATAVRRLHTIAEECDRHAKFWDEPLVVGAYVYGSLLEGPEEIELLQIALVIDLPPEEVTWWAEPPSAAAFAEIIGLGKAPVEWWWRPVLWPVWNHEIRGPVRFWSLDGPDEGALEAIAQRRLGVYPEHHLWRATKGYLDLLTAVDQRRISSEPA